MGVRSEVDELKTLARSMEITIHHFTGYSSIKYRCIGLLNGS
jgi:hypothetical protein